MNAKNKIKRKRKRKRKRKTIKNIKKINEKNIN